MTVAARLGGVLTQHMSPFLADSSHRAQVLPGPWWVLSATCCGEGYTADPKEPPVALSSVSLLSLIPHSSTDHRALKFTLTVGLGM